MFNMVVMIATHIRYCHVGSQKCDLAWIILREFADRRSGNKDNLVGGFQQVLHDSKANALAAAGDNDDFGL